LMGKWLGGSTSGQDWQIMTAGAARGCRRCAGGL